MATNTKSKGTAVVLTEQLIAGTNKHLTNLTQVKLDGGSFTPAQVVERLQALAHLRRDVEAAISVRVWVVAPTKRRLTALLLVPRDSMPGGGASIERS